MADLQRFLAAAESIPPAADPSYRGGRRDTGHTTTLTETTAGLDLLADLADTDTDLRFVLAGGTVAEGRLLWIGEDLVAVTTVLDPGPGTGYIRLCSVIEVSLSVSG